MSRKKIIKSDAYPYHTMSRSNQRTWFQLPMDQVWAICTEIFELANKKHPVRLHAFVLMKNHYHMVLSTPKENISDFMYEFNKNLSLKLRIQTKNINRMFGGRYKWCLIFDRQHYLQVLKYVYLNPNKVNLVSNAADYKYSTLYNQKKFLNFPIPITPFIDVLDQSFQSWIHEYHSEEQQKSIQKGLEKRYFKYSGSRQKRKPPEFDEFG